MARIEESSSIFRSLVSRLTISGSDSASSHSEISSLISFSGIKKPLHQHYGGFRGMPLGSNVSFQQMAEKVFTLKIIISSPKEDDGWRTPGDCIGESAPLKTHPDTLLFVPASIWRMPPRVRVGRKSTHGPSRFQTDISDPDRRATALRVVQSNIPDGQFLKERSDGCRVVQRAVPAACLSRANVS